MSKIIINSPGFVRAILNDLRSFLAEQDGSEWAETNVTGDDKIEDTVQCLSQSGRPGHTSIQVRALQCLLRVEGLARVHFVCSPTVEFIQNVKYGDPGYNQEWSLHRVRSW